MKLFPASWQIQPANHVCEEIVDCLNKTAPTVEWDTGFKMIRTTNVKSGRVDLEDVKFVEEAVFLKWTRRLLPRRNDIVLTREAPLGEIGLLRSDEKAMLGQRTMVYRADGKALNQIFLYYTLLGPILQAQIKTLGSGSTVEHMRVPDAETLSIPLPPIPEQEKVAAVLATYDDLIENNRRRIALLERMAEQLYREWFVRFRFPGYRRTSIQKGVPAGWHVRKLPALAEIAYGFPFAGNRFNTDGLGKPIVRIRNVSAASTSDFTDEVASDKYLIRSGDLLIGMDGEFHMNHWHGDEAYLVQRVCRIRAKKPEMRAYLYWALRAPIKHLEATIVGATVAHLGAKHLNAIDLLVPEGAAQGALEPLNNLLDQKLALARINDRLAKTRDLLLPRLISGKLRVDDLDIQFPPSMQAARA